MKVTLSPFACNSGLLSIVFYAVPVRGTLVPPSIDESYDKEETNKGMVRTVVARSTTHETSFESRQEIIDNHQVLGAMDEK